MALKQQQKPLHSFSEVIRNKIVAFAQYHSNMNNIFFGKHIHDEIAFERISGKSLSRKQWKKMEHFALFYLCLAISCSLISSNSIFRNHINIEHTQKKPLLAKCASFTYLSDPVPSNLLWCTMACHSNSTHRTVVTIHQTSY